MAVNFELIGTPCAQHAAYSIYKAFKYNCGSWLSGIISLGDFFYVKPWTDQEIICIGELQLVWQDDSHHVPLASIKLYFLPENTPNGRSLSHGQDEVISISDKVILKVDDLLSWLTLDVSWNRGAAGISKEICDQPAVLKDVSNFSAQDRSGDVTGEPEIHPGCGYTGLIDMREIVSHKKSFKSDRVTSAVTVLSYPTYCRYRAALKRYEGCEPQYTRHALAVALGSRSCPGPNTKIFFCKDTFDCVELENHPFVCNYLAPKWKGRPRKKRKIRSASPGSESLESESSGSYYSKKDSPYKEDPSNWSDRPKVEQLFLQKLHKFMAERGTPIGRLPSLGFKQLDLYEFFVKVQHAGGYDAAVSKKMWKAIYIELGGHPSNTSAATCTRKHYEKLLLPYEQLLVLPEEGASPKKRRKVTSQPEEGVKSEIRENGAKSDKKSSSIPEESLTSDDPCMQAVTLPKSESALNDLGRPTNQMRGQQRPAVPAHVQLHSDCGDSVHVSQVEKKFPHNNCVTTSTARPSVICKSMDIKLRQQQSACESDRKSKELPPAAHSQKPLTPLSSLPAELVYDCRDAAGESSPSRTVLRDPAALFAAMEFALRRPPSPLAASPSIFAPTRRIYGDPNSDSKQAKPLPTLDLSATSSSSAKKLLGTDSKVKGTFDFSQSTLSSAKHSPADVNISLNVKIEGGSNPPPKYLPAAKTVKEELKEKSRFNVKENSSRDKVTITAAYPKMVDSLASNSIGPNSNTSKVTNGVSPSHTAIKSAPKTVESPLFPHMVDPNIAAYYSMYSPHLYGHPLAHQANPYGAAAAAGTAGASAAEISAQVYKDLVQRGYPASLAAGMPPLGFGLNLPSLLQAMNTKENSGGDKSFVPKS